MLQAIRRLLAPVFLLSVFIALAFTGEDMLGLSREAMDQTRRILNLVVRTGLGLSAAFFVNRIVQVFVLDGLVARATGGKVPRLLKDMTAVAVFGVGIAVIAAVVFKQSLNGFWATSGVLTFVLGLALRPIILDVFTGLATNFDNPYRIGEWIIVHRRGGDTDMCGQVVEVNWRTTRLVTEKGAMVLVPNSTIATSVVTNLDRPEHPSRISTSFVLDFSVPVDRAMRVILAGAKAAVGVKGMLEDPRPKVLLGKTTELGVEYKVRFWIAPRKGTSPSKGVNAMTASVVRHLQQAGLTLAYPKRDIFEAPMPNRQLDGASIEDLAELLKRVPLFIALDDSERMTLAGSMDRRFVAGGKDVIAQGDPGKSMYILLEGLLDVLVGKPAEATDAAGAGAQMRVASIEPGRFFGEMSLLTGEPRSATVRAVTDAVVYEITHEDIRPLLEARPSLVDEMGRAAAARRLKNDAAFNAKSDAEQEAEAETLGAAIARKMRLFLSSVF
jgi:small-conductance mechanosensitive channel